MAARDPDSSQRRLGEGAPTVSQSAHGELAPTYPHQVYRLVCSHPRNTSSMASSVDQYSGSARRKPVRSSTSFPTEIFQASKGPFANARETEHYSRRTQEGHRGMCSNTLDPGGKVRGCSAGCTIAMSDVSTFLRVQLAGPYREFLLFLCFIMWVCGMRRDSFVF